jgi:hypothetical protein
MTVRLSHALHPFPRKSRTAAQLHWREKLKGSLDALHPRRAQSGPALSAGIPVSDV